MSEIIHISLIEVAISVGYSHKEKWAFILLSNILSFYGIVYYTFVFIHYSAIDVVVWVLLMFYSGSI